MATELLVRSYNVGLGDCIYLQIPDERPDDQGGGEEVRHVLIDCGTIYASTKVMQTALDHLETCLPLDPATGRRRLDLLVISHAHKDHLAAFDMNAEWFKSIDIGAIWLSDAMDPNHPQSEGARELHALARNAFQQLEQVSLGPDLDELVSDLYGVSGYANDDAFRTLREDLPAQNGIEPLYVHDETASETLAVFAENATRFRVLAPAHDLDGEYLGRTRDDQQSFAALAEAIAPGTSTDLAENWQHAEERIRDSGNVSLEDFRRLRSRMANNLLAFVLRDGGFINNTSVVLLLEWRGRRLLFTGDAQCEPGSYERGRSNGSWNVMWHHHQDLLRDRLDVLKLGHHGSHNATPWLPDEDPINDILDALVPADEPKTKIIVSTQRGKARSYRPIPNKHLMSELGRRVAHPRSYSESEEYNTPVFATHVVPDATPQPPRTDLEHQSAGGHWTPYIDVLLPPADTWPGQD